MDGILFIPKRDEELWPFLQATILGKRPGFNFESQVHMPSSQNTRTLTEDVEDLLQGRVLLLASASQGSDMMELYSSNTSRP